MSFINMLDVIFVDELGNKGEMTYSEIFEEVKLYAAAFRKHGLGVGDRIAGYICNIKEALFAFLAAASIGAIWGAAMPYLGPRAASNMMKALNPKIIIAVDYFHFDEEEFFPIENLSIVAEGLSNLEKVVIVPELKETLSRDISNIPKSIFLDDFLQKGRTPEGAVPDLEFEQLSSNHPVIINFTSGTTGIPKGIVHSAVAFIGFWRDTVFHLDLKSGDVVGNYSPAGWAVWVYTIPTLSLGIKLFLFNGSPIFKAGGRNLWDLLAENKVSYIFMASGDVDDMEDEDVVPGASEGMGTFSAYHLNLPLYACESQISALGVDLHIYDPEGNSVIGERGEIVITTPTPAFPLFIWGDKNSERLHEAYFNKYGIGVWCQNDEASINPETKGFSVFGRSDNVLKQFGERLSPDDMYLAIDSMEELHDYICVCQDNRNGLPRNILFVKLKEGYVFNSELKEKIAKTIQKELSSVSVPEVILEVPEIPYNINHKRLESVVKKIVNTNTIPVTMNIENPDCLQYYCNISEVINYD
ncbi:acetoacetyl-CoA synthetase [Nephila pilipes]|uniref:Acetoacetyl-CoA synthetase n=1 Tax=Nephila pilipes TaxID=299642 RepID=A0A8X6N701_NEPPI|nr:acetoacetyl-CoA synthetase [Nephila pilipes]